MDAGSATSDFSDFFERRFRRTCSAVFGGGRRGRGLLLRAAATTRPTLELSLEEAARGGRRTISLGGRPRLRGRHPARRPRRPAHPAGRRGRPRRRRRPRRATFPARPAEAAPAVPRRGPRPVRRPPGRAVGGGARRRGRGRRRLTARRVKVPRRLLERPAAAPARAGAARSAGGQGDLYAEVRIEVPKKLSRRGARALRASWRRSRTSTRGGGDERARDSRAAPSTASSLDALRARRRAAPRAGAPPHRARRCRAPVTPAATVVRPRPARRARAARACAATSALNYAGALLACELLDRIDELEARLRRTSRQEVTAWT